MSYEPWQDDHATRASRHVRSSEQMTRRSAVLTLFSALLPGAGLLRTRYSRLGVILMALAVLTLVGVIGLVILAGGPVQAALRLLVQPTALLLLAGMLVLGGLLWIWSVLLTHRGTRHPTMRLRQRMVLRAWTGLLCLALALPLGTAVSYSITQRDTLLTVFGRANNAPGTTRAAPQGGADPWANAPRVNVLLLGSDAGDDREGIRTDSMILASVDTRTGDTTMISLPRNLENVPFPKDNPLHKLWPKGYNCGSKCLLNGVWTLAVENKHLFPKDDENPGLHTLQGVIQEITGLRIDYTTIIDLAGFEQLVDAMGGVTVNVTERLPVEGYVNESGRIVGVQEWMEPGVQHLDGYHALWFARSRAASDDWSRMRRQRCLVGKIIDQVNPATMLQRYPALARVARDNITTDIPAADLPAWVTLVDRIKGAQMRSLALTVLNINPGDPDFEAIRKLIDEALDPRSVSSPTTSATKSSSSSSSAKSSTSSPSKSGSSSSSGTSKSSSRSSSTSSPTPTEDTVVDLAAAC